MFYNIIKALERQHNENEETLAEYHRRVTQEELPRLRAQAERIYLENYLDTRALDEIEAQARERIYKSKSVAGIDNAINKMRRQIVKDYTGQMGGIL